MNKLNFVKLSLIGMVVIALVGAVNLDLARNEDLPPPISVGAPVKTLETKEDYLKLVLNKKVHEVTDVSKSERTRLKSYLIENDTTLGKYNSDGSTEVQSGEYEIEITEINVREEGGLEVFAKAWKNGKPLGFGKDGSVEIERFIIPDPPVLVPTDGVADYTRYHRSYDPKTDTYSTTTSKFVEDPKLALKEVISQNVQIVGKEGTKIERGKVGNTTYGPFYSGAGDGGLGSKDNIESTSALDWVAEQTETTADCTDYTSAFLGCNFGIGWFYKTTGSAYKYSLERVILQFDTSTIPDTYVVSSSTISAYPQSSGEINNVVDTGNDYIYWCSGSTIAATSTLTANDFDNVCDSVGAPTEHTEQRDLSWISSNCSTSYCNFSVTEAGFANISKTGFDTWGGRIGDDVTAEPSGTRANNDWNRVAFESSEETSTTKDPKIVIEAAAHAASTNDITSDLIMFQ